MFLTDGKLPIISQESDFINGYWDNEADAIRIDSPVVVFGDHTQVLKLVDFDFVVGADGVKILKPKDFLDPAFLRYFLEANPTPSLGYARHYRHISGMEIPLPPLEEQKRIVAVLDQAFAALDRARAHAEANLADAEALFVKVAYDNLTTIAQSGKLVQVGEIAEHCLGKMLDKQKNKGTFRPYLRNINIRWFEIDTSDVLEMRIEDRELDRYEVRKGDLLICEGGYPGRASIYQSDDSTYFQKALHRVRFDDESLPKVLMYWLFVDDKLGKLSGHFSGTGISHFTGKALASYPMPVSDTTTNARAIKNIDRCLEMTNSLMAKYQAKLTDLADLRQSLLQKAFSGELT
ncbi:restriction endonuclease subunit S [Rhodanobacter sp. AS-Z3]|uniref:restriction endonuclease subunit S n=1 Tax=Rhodanobacter sp. AS-Z3 TaxID=3031330 RepID=UPI0024797F12|nr:restriction endonuclease subunit S [Rhodanobacter sp. AS-Z3]WEN15611.1 restriction endonuclease subunit S [Rhodanobacter sp. AS-Z3]